MCIQISLFFIFEILFENLLTLQCKPQKNQPTKLHFCLCSVFFCFTFFKTFSFFFFHHFFLWSLFSWSLLLFSPFSSLTFLHSFFVSLSQCFYLMFSLTFFSIAVFGYLLWDLFLFFFSPFGKNCPVTFFSCKILEHFIKSQCFQLLFGKYHVSFVLISSFLFKKNHLLFLILFILCLLSLLLLFLVSTFFLCFLFFLSYHVSSPCVCSRYV